MANICAKSFQNVVQTPSTRQASNGICIWKTFRTGTYKIRIPLRICNGSSFIPYIYINDLPKKIKEIFMELFADDTTISAF
jgi:hypothetical protein